MEDSRRSASIGLIVGAILLCLLAAYVIGYFALGESGYFVGTRPARARIYSYEWQADLFRPAARVETLLVGQAVETGSD